MTDRRRPAHTRGEHLLQIAEAKNSGEQMSALSSHNSHWARWLQREIRFDGMPTVKEGP